MNLIAILLSAVAALAVGFAWYHPKTFGTTWMRGVGLTEERIAAAGMGLRYALVFVLAMMMAVFVAYLGANHPEEVLAPWQHFAYHGVQMGLVFVGPVLVIVSLFEQLSARTILINVGYWVVTLGVMGLIIGAMGPS